MSGVLLTPETKALKFHDRRLKIVSVYESLIIDLMAGRKRLVGLPEDATVCSVHNNYACNALDLIVWSSEFPVAREGMELERIVCEAVSL